MEFLEVILTAHPTGGPNVLAHVHKAELILDTIPDIFGYLISFFLAGYEWTLDRSSR